MNFRLFARFKLYLILVTSFFIVLYWTIVQENNYSIFMFALENATEYKDIPDVKDNNLNVEIVAKGIEHPTGIAFLGPDDIVVSEKDSGKVMRILNGKILPEPLLDVSVSTERERGLLGIAVNNVRENSMVYRYLFVYFTASNSSKDGYDSCPPPQPYFCDPDREPSGNRLYRFQYSNNQLFNPRLLLDLPASPSPNHNGGVITIGPDNNIYTVIGDLLSFDDRNAKSEVINFKDSKVPDGRSGILRITNDGKTVGNGILGSYHPLNKYYAYGIRNSFGIDFDPLTGNLWDTENGPAYGDEINLVRPGFNSGWIQVQGLWQPIGIDTNKDILDVQAGDPLHNQDRTLIDFDGKGKYSPPEFIWNQTVGLTAIKFLNSDKLGKEYENDMLVGDFNNGNIYHFDLNKERTELVLMGNLTDKIADTNSETNDSNILFANGFKGVSDIEIGPYDGFLYILSYLDGALYKIVPK